MRKDSAKVDYTAKRRSPWRAGLRWVSMGGVLVVFAGAFFFAYQHKAHLQYYSVANGYLTRFSTWFAERKHHLQDGLVKVKQLATAKNNAEEEIHFEFYTALPNMQVSVSDSRSKEERAAVANAKKLSSIKSNAANKPVISASEIEKELEAQLNKKY